MIEGARTKAVLLGAIFYASVALSGEPAKPRWVAMEYGPTLALTLRTPPDDATLKIKYKGEDYKQPNDGYTLKALTVRVDKEKKAYVCYDEETLRMSCAWDGNFIDYNGVIFNGEHHVQPAPKGTLRFATRNGPGWAKDGNFEDPRKDHSGPLGADWVKFHGHYMNGEKVVLSYSVGDCKILEMPGVQFAEDKPVFSRTFNAGTSTKPLQLLLCTSDGAEGKVEAGNIAVLTTKEGPIAACLVGAPDGTQWDVSGGKIVAKIPALKAPANFRILISNQPKFEAFTGTPAENLEALTKGGAPRWPEIINTQGTLGTPKSPNDPYVVDTIAAPELNPWNAWMRFGGFDFFSDNKRAALCTWSGDVWIVSGIDEPLKDLRWKRFASGLYQGLGLKIVDDVVYVTNRDQITRLQDLNGDGEADFYECFNNDAAISRHFHEFAMGLETDKDGNFFYARGATPGRGGPNFDLWALHTGCFLKVSKDGSKMDVIARGLRAPNGIGISPDGMLTSCDNEGSWVPMCPINLIKPGAFVGIPDGVPGDVKPTKRDDPICWMPWQVDNSGGGQVWVTDDRWGPFKNHMMYLSYGKCSLFNVMMETVGETMQAGTSRFPLEFASGVNRARFNPADGQLYVSGLRGWQTTAARDGVFQRVRYTGKPVQMPIDMHVKKEGVEITFTNALDKESAVDAQSYAAWWFNIKWQKDYGSDRYSPTDPNKKYGKNVKEPPGDPLEIKSAKLSSDGKTVSLEIPNMMPVTNMVIKMKLKAADGSTIDTQICNTINKVP